MSVIVVNDSEENVEMEKPIEIYLSTNGVHTDFVLPISNEIVDWKTKINWANEKSHWLAFGWGDKGFYLNTPEWSDLKISTAFNAISGLGESAMHVTSYSNFKSDNSSVKIKLTKEQYQLLVNYIIASFLSENDSFRKVENSTYTNFDAFYDAKGSYSLFYTCNTWVNQGLKQINQKAALWTLHDQGIFRHYK